jgi:hypothetical protein
MQNVQPYRLGLPMKIKSNPTSMIKLYRLSVALLFLEAIREFREGDLATMKNGFQVLVACAQLGDSNCRINKDAPMELCLLFS